MNKDVDALVNFRLSKSNESFELAKLAIEKTFWNSAASELYYSCFYLLTALFAKHNILSHTHSGVKTIFGLKFIKENKVEPKWGRLLATLFDTRQKSDYGDFIILSELEIMPLLKEVEEFREVIGKLIKKESL